MSIFRESFCPAVFGEVADASGGAAAPVSDEGGSDVAQPPASNSLMGEPNAAPPTESKSLMGEPGIPPPPEDLSTVDLTQGQPDWVPAKFWDSSTNGVNGLAAVKSALSLERSSSALANGGLSTPEGYLDGGLFDSEGKSAIQGVELTREDPILQGIAKIAQESGMNGVQFDRVVEGFLTLSAQKVEVDNKVFQQSQREELGTELPNLSMENKVFMAGLKASGAITEEQNTLAFEVLGSTAEGVRLLNAFAKSQGSAQGSAIPGNADSTLARRSRYTEVECKEAFVDERNDPNSRKFDQAFHAKVEEMFADFYGTELVENVS